MSQLPKQRVLINLSPEQHDTLAHSKDQSVKKENTDTLAPPSPLLGDMIHIIITKKKRQLVIPRLALLDQSTYYQKIHEFDPTVPLVEIEDCTPSALQLTLGYILSRFGLGPANYPSVTEIDRHDIYETELLLLSRLERAIFSLPIILRTEVLFLADFLGITDLIHLLNLSFRYATEDKTIDDISTLFQQPSSSNLPPMPTSTKSSLQSSQNTQNNAPKARINVSTSGQ